MADDSISLENLREQAALLETIAEREEILNQLLQEKLDTQYKFMTQAEKEHELALENLKIQSQRITDLKAVADAKEALAKLDKTDNEYTKTKVAFEKIINELQEKYGDVSAESLEAAKEMAKVLEGEVKSTKKLSDSAKNTEAVLESQLEQMFGLKNTAGSLGEELIDNLDSAKGFKNVLAKTMLTLGKVFSLSNLIKKAWATTTSGFFGFDSLIAKWDRIGQELTQATGATEKYGKESKSMIVTMLDQAFLMEETAGAYRTLFQASEAFSEISAKGRKELTEQALQLSRLGVQTTTYAATVDGLNKLYGNSPAKIKSTTKQLSDFGRALGTGPNKMLEHFNNNLNLMAYYGEKKGIDMLKKLAVTAKKTGIEMNKLVSIAEKFDTFEGSAESVGQLNMLLGGPYLNSVKMMTASEEERIEMMREAVRASGQQFDQMNKYQKQAIAQAMGTEVHIAQKLFSDKNINSIKDATAAVSAQADGFGSLSEQAAKATDDAKKKAAADQMMLKNAEALAPILKWLNTLIIKITGLFNEWAPVIAVVGMAFKALMAWKLGSMLTGLTTSLWTTIKATRAMGVASKLMSGTMLSSISTGVTGSIARLNMLKMTAMRTMGAIGGAIGLYYAATAEKKDASTAMGGAMSGAMLGASIGSFIMPGLGTLIGGGLGAIGGAALGYFEDGGDALSAGAKIVGDSSTGKPKPEIAVTPPNSNIISNTNLETISSLVEAFTAMLAGNQQPAPAAAAGARPEKQTINVTLKLDSDILAKQSAEVATNVVNTMLDFE